MSWRRTFFALLVLVGTAGLGEASPPYGTEWDDHGTVRCQVSIGLLAPFGPATQDGTLVTGSKVEFAFAATSGMPPPGGGGPGNWQHADIRTVRATIGGDEVHTYTAPPSSDPPTQGDTHGKTVRFTSARFPEGVLLPLRVVAQFRLWRQVNGQWQTELSDPVAVEVKVTPYNRLTMLSTTDDVLWEEAEKAAAALGRALEIPSMSEVSDDLVYRASLRLENAKHVVTSPNWDLTKSIDFLDASGSRLLAKSTIFVGAAHGMLSGGISVGYSDSYWTAAQPSSSHVLSYADSRSATLLSRSVPAHNLVALYMCGNLSASESELREAFGVEPPGDVPDGLNRAVVGFTEPDVLSYLIPNNDSLEVSLDKLLDLDSNPGSLRVAGTLAKHADKFFAMLAEGFTAQEALDEANRLFMPRVLRDKMLIAAPMRLQGDPLARIGSVYRSQAEVAAGHGNARDKWHIVLN